MPLDFEEMRRIYRLEKSTTRLVEVPEDFYGQLHGLIDEERKKYFDSLKDLNTTRARDFGNLKKLVEEWFLVREKKLFNNVLICASLGETDQTHLAREEKKMFEDVFHALSNHRLLTKQVLDANGVLASEFKSTSPRVLGNEKEKGAENENLKIVETPNVSSPPVNGSQSSSSGFLSIKLLAEIPSFVGTDLKEYGPYQQGQVVELPSKIAQLFISRKLGEKPN